MNNPDDVAESEKIEGSIFGSKDSQTVASNVWICIGRIKPMEFKPNPSSIDAEKVGERKKYCHPIRRQCSNNLDLTGENVEMINDVALKDSGEAFGF
uniref:Uncharacterized protein n=1 Tax=Salix viminalis TaxID=40686 RepID=A0A6N2KCW3_SALVM